MHWCARCCQSAVPVTATTILRGIAAVWIILACNACDYYNYIKNIEWKLDIILFTRMMLVCQNCGVLSDLDLREIIGLLR